MPKYVGKVGREVEAREQRVAGLDVEVEVGQGFELGKAGFGQVVGVLEQLYPEAQAADADGVRVDIDPKQGVLDEVALLLKQGALQAGVPGRHGALPGGGR